ncbi:hypothetical protein P20652_1444 [Pseudoalteromonas sp. BSi20652]|nr:hypothetical protein P20652_1444 [Pseudoalteromonas sp. BSi20652]
MIPRLLLLEISQIDWVQLIVPAFLNGVIDYAHGFEGKW